MYTLEKLTAMPKIDRPREKLKCRGVEALSTKELVAILLGSGIKGKNVLLIAEALLRQTGGKKLSDLSLDEIQSIQGIGSVRAATFIAAFELGKRYLLKEETKPAFESAKEVFEYCQDMRSLKKEHFVSLYLNAKNRLILRETIAIGSLFSNLIHPREVFAPAISNSTAFVILVHNHPSGDPEPSENDLLLTKRLVECGKLLGIDVLDHVIIGKNSFVSLQELLKTY